jgi:hypothetical protein
MSFLSAKRLLSLIIVSSFFIINVSSFAAATQKTVQSISIQKQLAKLEASSKERIGVYAINTANNTHLGYRASERFPTGCTSKIIGVATILSKSMGDTVYGLYRDWLPKSGEELGDLPCIFCYYNFDHEVAETELITECWLFLK